MSFIQLQVGQRPQLLERRREAADANLPALRQLQDDKPVTAREQIVTVEFSVPGEPQGKGRARVGSVNGKARMFTPAKTVAYEGLIALAAQAAMQGRELFTGPMLLQVTAYFPIRDSWSKKKREDALENAIVPDGLPDLDNIAKAICDGMNGVVWKDDRQVAELHMRKLYAETPRVEVWTVPL